MDANSLALLDLGIKVFGGATAFVLFVVGLSRYSKEQNWKRKEFVASEMKDFFNAYQNIIILKLIDWSVPTKLELFPKHPEFDKRYVKMGREEFLMAILPGKITSRDFTDVDVALKECFDYFLDNLEKFEHFIEAGLVKPKEFIPYLQYYMNVLTSVHDEKIRIAIFNYLERFHFKKAIKFINRFGVKYAYEGRIDEISALYQGSIKPKD